LDVDGDDPRRTGDASTAYRVKPDASSAEDHNRISGDDARRVQHRAGTGDNAAPKQRCLSEGHLLGHCGELVLMNESSFGKATQSQALVQAFPLAA
jgi:hypothetical protein